MGGEAEAELNFFTEIEVIWGERVRREKQGRNYTCCNRRKNAKENDYFLKKVEIQLSPKKAVFGRGEALRGTSLAPELLVRRGALACLFPAFCVRPSGFVGLKALEVRLFFMVRKTSVAWPILVFFQGRDWLLRGTLVADKRSNFH